MALYQGKRKMEALPVEGEAKNGQKTARMWEEEKEKAMLSNNANANGYWMRQQHPKQEVAATSSHAQLSYQQRIMAAAALQDIRAIDSNGNSSCNSRQVFQPPSPRLHHLQQTFVESSSLIDCSGAGTHSLMSLPSSGPRSSKHFSDHPEAHASTAAAAALAYTPQSVHGHREMQSTSSVAMTENEDQYLKHLLLSKSGYHRQQNGLRSSAAGVLIHDQQVAASAWFPTPAARGPNNLDTAFPSPGFLCSASVSQLTDQPAVAPLASCVPACRDLTKEQEQAQASGTFMQPRLLNHSMPPPNSIVPSMRTSAMPGQAPSPLTAPTTPDMATTSNNTHCNGATNAETNAIVAAPRNKASVRTYIKVYKRGSIGRALDVRRFCDYTELKSELGRMFGLDGQLDQKSGWQVVFTDDQDELLLLGDDPWEEFVRTVRRIQILSPSEVAYYMNWDERTAPVPYSPVNSTVMKRL